MTVPDMTARIGVPIALAMSMPEWKVPQREPNGEVRVPTAGRATMTFGVRAALSAAATSSL